MNAAIVVSCVLAVGSPAAAGVLGDALAAKDAAALRDKTADVSARCTLAAIHAKRGDLTRASMYQRGCLDDALALDAEIASDVRRTLRDLAKTLKASDLYQADLQSTPDGLTVALSGYLDEAIVTPVMVYLKPGQYEAAVTFEGVIYKQTINAKAGFRGPAMFITHPPVKPTTKVVVVDMTENSGGGDLQVTGGPKDIKHPPITPDKYRGVTHASGPPIDDPLIAGPAARHDRAWSLGARVGGGLFDDAALGARPGVAVALVGRSRFGAERWFIDGRLDWTRGGAAMDGPVDAIGAVPGFGARLVETDGVVVSAAIGMRVDLRLQATQDMLPVSRLGLGATGAIDVAVLAVPLTAGLRFEQGVTALRDGRRDLAILLEVGWDWR